MTAKLGDKRDLTSEGRTPNNTLPFLMLDSQMVSVSLEARHTAESLDLVSLVTRWWVTPIPHLCNWLYDPNVRFHIYLHQIQIISQQYEGNYLQGRCIRDFYIQLSEVCLFSHTGSSKLKCRMGTQPFSWKPQTVTWSTLTLTERKNPQTFIIM